MDNIENLIRIDYLTVFLGIFVILFAMKELIELILYFKKRFRIKTGIDTEKETIEGRISKLEIHDKWQYNEISKISKGIDEIKSSLAQKESKDKAKTVATLRSQLYDLHSKFVERGYIDKSGLKTFTALGSIYESAGGDDIYHDKLKPEVLALPIHDD